jgi:hypothetical protein
MQAQVRTGWPGTATVYKGVCFRSRLEARWAVFFDLLGWPWQYEPLQLGRYLPDFALLFHRPVFVEVKPARRFAELHPHTARVQASTYIGEFLLVGGRLWTPRDLAREGGWDTIHIGLLHENLSGLDPALATSYTWAPAPFIECLRCGRPSFCHSIQNFYCRVCCRYDNNADIGSMDQAAGLALWRASALLLQWNARRNKP